MRDAERGFTLIEVLVALVVAAILIAVIMDGAASARQAKQSQILHHDATRLGRSVMTQALITDNPIEAAEGTEADLSWKISERFIERDARGFFALAEVRVDVADREGHSLQSFVTRKIRKLARS